MDVIGFRLLTVLLMLLLIGGSSRVVFEYRVQRKSPLAPRVVRLTCLGGLLLFCVATLRAPTSAHNIYALALAVLLAGVGVLAFMRQRARMRSVATRVGTLASWQPSPLASSARAVVTALLSDLEVAAKTGEVANQRAQTLLIPLLAEPTMPETTAHYLGPVVAYQAQLQKGTIAGLLTQSTVKTAARFDDAVQLFVLLWSSGVIPQDQMLDARALVAELIQKAPPPDLAARIASFVPTLVERLRDDTVAELVEVGETLENGWDLMEKVIAPALAHSEHARDGVVALLQEHPGLQDVIDNSPMREVVEPFLKHDAAGAHTHALGMHHGHGATTYGDAMDATDASHLGGYADVPGFDGGDTPDVPDVPDVPDGSVDVPDDGGIGFGDLMVAIKSADILARETKLVAQGKKTLREAVKHGGFDFAGMGADMAVGGTIAAFVPPLIPVVVVLKLSGVSFTGLFKYFKRGELREAQRALQQRAREIEIELLPASKQVYQEVERDVRGTRSTYESRRLAPVAWQGELGQLVRPTAAELYAALDTTLQQASAVTRVAEVYAEPGWRTAISRFVLGVPSDLLATSTALSQRLAMCRAQCPSPPEVSASPVAALARLIALAEQTPTSGPQEQRLLLCADGVVKTLGTARQSLTTRIEAYNQQALSRYLEAATSAAEQVNDQLTPYIALAQPCIHEIEQLAGRLEDQKAKLGER